MREKAKLKSRSPAVQESREKMEPKSVLPTAGRWPRPRCAVPVPSRGEQITVERLRCITVSPVCYLDKLVQVHFSETGFRPRWGKSINVRGRFHRICTQSEHSWNTVLSVEY